MAHRPEDPKAEDPLEDRQEQDHLADHQAEDHLAHSHAETPQLDRQERSSPRAPGGGICTLAHANCIPFFNQSTKFLSLKNTFMPF